MLLHKIKDEDGLFYMTAVDEVILLENRILDRHFGADFGGVRGF